MNYNVYLNFNRKNLTFINTVKINNEIFSNIGTSYNYNYSTTTIPLLDY